MHNKMRLFTLLVVVVVAVAVVVVVVVMVTVMAVITVVIFVVARCFLVVVNVIDMNDYEGPPKTITIILAV